jgi:TrmH family RNA methyltransferase
LPATITSTANRKVKYVRSLYRRRVRHKEKHFVIEGLRLVEEALKAGVAPALAFFTPALSGSQRGRKLLAVIEDLPGECFVVTDKVMRDLSDTVSPQGILAVVPFLEFPVPENPQLVLVVDRVRDPGNLGTILRSAEAAGASQVILTPATVDIYSPKVVRGAMGAHFHLPIAARVSWSEVAEVLEDRQILLAEAKGEKIYYEVDWTKPSVLIVSSEAEGASQKAKRLATERIVIPMQGKAESLNVAVAASVILFEAARQRGIQQDGKDGGFSAHREPQRPIGRRPGRL